MTPIPMPATIECQAVTMALNHDFTIARGSKKSATMVRVIFRDNNRTTMGDGVIYPRYNQTMDESLSVLHQSKKNFFANKNWQEPFGNDIRFAAACHAMTTAWVLWQGDIAAPSSAATFFTLSIDSPDNMASAAHQHRNRPFIKIKMAGDDGDTARLTAIIKQLGSAKLLLDPNESWNQKTYHDFLSWYQALSSVRQQQFVAIEQPFPERGDDILSRLPRPIKVVADESFHQASDIEKVKKFYDAVNIKMDKCGGYEAGLKAINAARRHGLSIMLGSMVGSSLALIAPFLLSSHLLPTDWLDLDGANFIKDEDNPLHALFCYDDQSVMTPNHAMKRLWKKP